MPVKFKNNIDVDGYASAEYLDLSTTTTHVVNAGEIAWNSADGTFDIGLLNGVTLQAGQEMHFYGKATEDISNGNAVMFAGVQGDHILIAKADAATINANPEYFMGVATQDFTTNEFGYVTAFGNVRGLNTVGYTLGSVLYYDSTTATDGLLTSTMPSAPNAKILVAAVVRVHSTQGILMVRPHTMPKISDIQDVNTSLSKTTPIDADSLLLQDSADSSIWKKLSWSNTKATLKTYFDTIYQSVLTNPVTGTGTTNYVTKFTGTSTVGNSQLFDNGTFVGIGTASSVGNDFVSIFYNSSTSRNQAINVKDTNSSANGSIFSVYRKSDDTYLGAISRNGTSDALFVYGNDHLALGSGASERMRITSTGNVGIGTTSPSEKLEVQNGTSGAKIKVSNTGGGYATLECSSNATSVAQLSFTNQLSLIGGSVGIGTTSPASLLQVDGATPFITINKTSGSTLGTTFKSSGTTVGELNLNTSSGEFKTSSGFSGYGGFLTYYTNGSEKMRVFSTGGVSIGTTSDLFYTSGRGTLTLNGSTDSIFTLANGGTFAAYMWASSSKLEISTNAQPIVLITNGGERMRITAAGKIGIGTSNPSSRFTVEDSTAFSWGFPSVASAKIGTPGTGGSFLVMTPSLNSSYESGFAVDGTYSGGKSVINLSAFGVYSGGPYSADIAFKTATNLTLSEKMRITNDGKVGIGTSSPSGRLQVSSATAGDDQIWLQSTTYTGGYSTLGYNANTGEFRIKQNDGGSAGITFYTGASASEKMRITPAGNVGIGTTSPTQPLEVNGTILSTTGSSGTIALGATTVRIEGNASSREMMFYTFNSERMRITSAGDVGIGTSSPTAKLMALSNGAGWTGWIENQDTAGNGSGLVVRAASNSGGFTMLLQKQDATSTFAVTGSGNVGIGTASPDASAVLNLESTTQGFLLPRMGDTEMNNISSPAQGLMIFNLSVNAVCVFDGSTWQRLAYL